MKQNSYYNIDLKSKFNEDFVDLRIMIYLYVIMEKLYHIIWCRIYVNIEKK